VIEYLLTAMGEDALSLSHVSANPLNSRHNSMVTCLEFAKHVFLKLGKRVLAFLVGLLTPSQTLLTLADCCFCGRQTLLALVQIMCTCAHVFFTFGHSIDDSLRSLSA
jgi:hypothetical protein